MTVLERLRGKARWLVVAGIVIALHLVVLGWLGRLPAPADVMHAVRIVEASLLAPKPPPAPVRATPAARPPRQAPEAPSQAVTTAPQPESATTVVGQAEAGKPAPEAAPAQHPSPAGAPAGEARFDLPPSATLQYDTFVNGIRNQNGALRWETNGSRYTLSVETRVPFLGRFAFESEGHVDAYGLAPDRYTEIRGRRDPATATFSREGAPTATPTVTFSRSGRSAPLQAGTQDRFSVFVQMAGLLRGAAERYATPGDTLPFTVADTRDAEPMRIQFVGEESVEIAGGRRIQARHFIRLPRHADDQRVVEVWLAAELSWLPARLRQTEPNGTQFELRWRNPNP